MAPEIPHADGSITNARLVDGRLVNVAVADGLIVAVTPSSNQGGNPHSVAAEHDLDGWLLLPAMAEPHAHLDKALTADLVPNPGGDLQGAIDAWIATAGRGEITYEDTVMRAARAIEMLITSGVTAVRSHVNVGPGYGASSIRAVHEARAQFEGLVEVQTVALVQSPLAGSAGAANRAALDEAVEAGVDAIGGCPHLEADGAGMIAHAIAVASDAGLPIDLHVDETLDASMLTLPEFARQVIDRGFERGVTASHCVSLGMQGPTIQHEVAALVAEANMAVVALPQTNLFLQSRGVPTAPPRGLTALDPLIEAGALVCAGGDNVQDPFNLMGRADPLETAALMVMAGHRTPEDAYDMVSSRSRQAMGLPPVTIVPGSPGDLVAIDATSTRHAIASAPLSRKTFRAGRLVASSTHSAALRRST